MTWRDLIHPIEEEVARIDVYLQDGGKGKKGKKDKQKARLIRRAAKDTENVVEEEEDDDDVISIWSSDDEYDINLNDEEFMED